MEVDESMEIGARAASFGGPPTVDSIDEAGDAAGGGDGEEDAGAEDGVESLSDDESAMGGEEGRGNDTDEEGSVSDSSDDDDDDDDDDRSSSGEESDDDDEEEGEEEAGANEGLSHYERLRLERIARNNARLASLGFSETPKEKKERKKAPHRPRKSLEPAGPRRQLPGRAGRATFNASATLALARKAKREKQEKSLERKEKKKKEKKNLDACWVCQKEEGELRCCDYCRKLYHPQCHVPPIQPDDDEFKCNLCEKAGRTRRVACGKCEGCTREADCMTCVACYNKYERNGQKGKCIFRKCRSWGKANLICATGNNNDSNNKISDEVGEKDGGNKENEDGGGEDDHDDDDDTRSHDDECFVCGNGGDLICCDSCPKVYHSNCHKPKIHSLPEGEWNCQHCVKEKAAAAAAQKAKEKKGSKYAGTLVADMGHKEVKCTVRFPKIECDVCHEVEVTGAYKPPEWVSCGSCNVSYHLKCLDPPLQTRPNNWRCPSCKEKKKKIKKEKSADRRIKKEKEESKPLFEGEHDDHCFMCFIGGDLLCCDFCSKAYHLECHLPPLLEIPDGIWKCQECSALEYVRKFKCGECKACLRDDCGKCSMCLDKPKFGGPNKLKQVCVHRKCPYMRFAKPNKATLQSKKKTKKELKLQFKKHSSLPPPTGNKKKKKSMDSTVKREPGLILGERSDSREINPKNDTTPQSILNKNGPKWQCVECSPSSKKRKVSGVGRVDASEAVEKIGSEATLGSPTRRLQAFTAFKGQKVVQPSSASGITSIETSDPSREDRNMHAQEIDAKEQKEMTLKEIKKLLERPLKGDPDNGMRNIINYALRNPDNSKAQGKACEHLRLLATSTDNVAKIILLGGLKVVLQALKNHAQNIPVQVEACTFLIELIVVQPSCTTAIVEERCLQLTASSMQCHGTHLKLQQMACGLFRAMSYDFANHGSIAVIGVEAVTDAMKRNPRKHGIFKESCYFLQNLFCNPEIETDAIKIVLSKGTILHIIDTLVEDVKFFESGHVLTNLATNERAKAHIGSYDLSIPTALLTVLRPGVYADACKCSLDVLTLLATGSASATSKVIHLGGIQKVMDFLTPSNDVGLADTALKLLAELTKENGDNAQLFITTGGLGLVTRLMTRHPNFPNIQASCCRVLRNLKQGPCEIAQANDSVRLILAAMNAHKEHKSVQFEACHALLQYCSCFPAIAESMQSKGAFPIKPDDLRLSKRKRTPSPKRRKSSAETGREDDQPLGEKSCVPVCNSRKEPGVFSSSEIDSIMKSKPLKGDPIGNKIRLITVKALKNQDNSKYQDKACEILRRHASSAGNVSKIVRLGGLKMVAKAMKDHSHKSLVQAEACALLAELAWVNSSCVAAIVEEGCPQLALISMQHHGTNLKVQQMACGFFRAMSYDFVNHQIINNINGVGAVIDAMKRNPKKYIIFKEACYFLQNMLCNPNIPPETIELIVSKGTVPVILAMCEKTHDSDFVSAACGVLANLAIDESAREHIGSCDLSIPTLLSIIASGIDPDASKCSLNCLSLLSSGNDRNIAKVISLGGIKILMNFLTPPNDVVLADSGMRLLTELTKNSQVNSQLFLDSGGFDFLTTEMKNNADSLYLQARACRVLRYLTVGVDNVNAAIGLILRAMKAHTEDEVQYEGCHALLRYCCLFPIATAGLMNSEEAGSILAQSQFLMPHYQ